MQKAIAKIMDGVSDECVITSCGYISREVYRYKDRPRNFYLLGSMGSVLGVALGLAYQRPDLKVVAIQGDGATLISMGTLALLRHLILPNMFLYILDNNSYASTGGQKACPFCLTECVNMKVVTCGNFSNAPRVPLSPTEIKRRFCESIHKQKV